MDEKAYLSNLEIEVKELRKKVKDLDSYIIPPAAGYYFATAWVAHKAGYEKLAERQLFQGRYILNKWESTGDEDIYVEVEEEGFFSDEELNEIRQYVQSQQVE